MIRQMIIIMVEQIHIRQCFKTRTKKARLVLFDVYLFFTDFKIMYELQFSTIYVPATLKLESGFECLVLFRFLAQRLWLVHGIFLLEWLMKHGT